MDFFLILGATSLVIGIIFLIISFVINNPKFLVSVTGKLVEKKGFRNYFISKLGTVTNATEYTYAYEVNGRTYKLSGVQYKRSNAIPDRTTIVYLRGFPGLAHEKNFYRNTEQLAGIVSVLISVLLFAVYFIAA